MTDQTLGAHTHGDQTEDDPGTAMRLLRRGASGAAVIVTALSFACLATGLWDDNLRVWNLGLTGLIVTVLTGGIAVGAYVGELIDRGRLRDREQLAELQEQFTELRGQLTDLRDRIGDILHRLSDVEAGERAIAGAMRDMSEPADEPDELDERRRSGGRQS